MLGATEGPAAVSKRKNRSVECDTTGLLPTYCGVGAALVGLTTLGGALPCTLQTVRLFADFFQDVFTWMHVVTEL